jgi:hypothetical protein
MSHGFLRAASGEITTFDPVGSTNTQTGDPGCINDKGAIVGSYLDGIWHGYLRKADGTITTFDPPESTGTIPLAINDKGQIVGFYSDSSGLNHGFLLSAGTYTIFDPDQSTNTEPTGINDTGMIGGEYQDSAGIWHGFVRAADGTLTAFNVKGAVNTYDSNSQVNSEGTLTGDYEDTMGKTHGYVRAVDGKIATFDVLTVGSGTHGYDLNDKGTSTGPYYTASGSLGYIRNAHGTITKFHDPDAGKALRQGTVPYGINNAGWIEGYYIDSSNVSHGFLRKP